MFEHKIVAIDDEEALLENYNELLSDRYEVATFSRGRDFIASLDQKELRHPNLIIVDLKMPDMDGISLLKEAQKKNCDCPAILLSGYLDKKSTLDAMELGVFRFLEKPVDFEKILNTVEELLIEGDLRKTRKEIRSLTSQLRELYSSIRLVVLPYVPDEILERLVVQTNQGTNQQKKISLDDALEGLELKLDNLLKTEKILIELLDQKK